MRTLTITTTTVLTPNGLSAYCDNLRMCYGAEGERMAQELIREGATQLVSTDRDGSRAVSNYTLGAEHH
jgi:hypothetical protein